MRIHSSQLLGAAILVLLHGVAQGGACPAGTFPEGAQQCSSCTPGRAAGSLAFPTLRHIGVLEGEIITTNVNVENNSLLPAIEDQHLLFSGNNTVLLNKAPNGGIARGYDAEGEQSINVRVRAKSLPSTDWMVDVGDTFQIVMSSILMGGAAYSTYEKGINPSAWFCYLKHALSTVQNVIDGVGIYRINTQGDTQRCFDSYGAEVTCGSLDDVQEKPWPGLTFFTAQIDNNDLRSSNYDGELYLKRRNDGDQDSPKTLKLPVQSILSDTQWGIDVYRIGESALGVCFDPTPNVLSLTLASNLNIGFHHARHFLVRDFFQTDRWVDLLISRDFTGRVKIFKDRDLMASVDSEDCLSPSLYHPPPTYTKACGHCTFAVDDRAVLWHPIPYPSLICSRAPFILGAQVYPDLMDSRCDHNNTGNDKMAQALGLFFYGDIQHVSLYAEVHEPSTLLTGAQSNAVCEVCPFALRNVPRHVGGGACYSAAEDVNGDVFQSHPRVLVASTGAELVWAVSSAPTNGLGFMVEVNDPVIELHREIVIVRGTNVSLRSTHPGGTTIVRLPGTTPGRHLRINEGGLLHEVTGFTFVGGVALIDENWSLNVVERSTQVLERKTTFPRYLYASSTLTRLVYLGGDRGYLTDDIRPRLNFRAAAGSGGSILNLGVVGSIRGCIFVNNTASDSGGAVYNGVVLTTSDDLRSGDMVSYRRKLPLSGMIGEIVDCTFSHNRIVGRYGVGGSALATSGRVGLFNNNRIDDIKSLPGKENGPMHFHGVVVLNPSGVIETGDVRGVHTCHKWISDELYVYGSGSPSISLGCNCAAFLATATKSLLRTESESPESSASLSTVFDESKGVPAPPLPLSRDGDQCHINPIYHAEEHFKTIGDDDSSEDSEISTNMFSEYCASHASVMRKFKYKGWQQSEPSGFVAALTTPENSATKFFQTYGSIVDSMAGNAKCSRALKSYFCSSFFPGCRFDHSEQKLRVCGTCRSSCKRYFASCPESVRLSLAQVAIDTFLDLVFLKDEDLCPNIENLETPIRNFLQDANCDALPMDQCTSDDAATCLGESGELRLSQTLLPVAEFSQIGQTLPGRNLDDFPPIVASTPSATLRLLTRVSTQEEEYLSNANQDTTSRSKTFRNSTLRLNAQGDSMVLPPGSWLELEGQALRPLSARTGGRQEKRLNAYTLIMDVKYSESNASDAIKCLDPNLQQHHIESNGYHWGKPSWERSACFVSHPGDSVTLDMGFRQSTYSNPGYYRDGNGPVHPRNETEVCTVLGALDGCPFLPGNARVEDVDVGTKAAFCGASFTVGKEPENFAFRELVFQTYPREIKSIGSSKDIWVRLVLSVDLHADYVRAVANVGGGAVHVVFDESWFDLVSSTANNGKRTIDDVVRKIKYLMPDGPLGLSPSHRFGYDCAHNTHVSSIALYRAALHEEDMKRLAGDVGSPLSFLFSMSASSVEIIEGETSVVVVKMTHKPKFQSYTVKYTPTYDDGSKGELVFSSPSLTFTKDDWRIPQTIELSLDDDDFADNLGRALVRFSSTPSALFIIDEVEVAMVDDDVASILLTFAITTAFETASDTDTNLDDASPGVVDDVEDTSGPESTYDSMQTENAFVMEHILESFNADCPVEYTCIRKDRFQDTESDAFRETVLLNPREPLIYTLSVNSEPKEAVTITTVLFASNVGLGSAEAVQSPGHPNFGMPLLEVSPVVITIDESNWNVPQEVTVRFKPELKLSEDSGLQAQIPLVSYYVVEHFVSSVDPSYTSVGAILPFNIVATVETSDTSWMFALYIGLPLILLLCTSTYAIRRRSYKVARVAVERASSAERNVMVLQRSSQQLKRQISLLRPPLSEEMRDRVQQIMGPVAHNLKGFAVSEKDIELLSHIGRGATSDVWRAIIRNVKIDGAAGTSETVEATVAAKSINAKYITERSIKMFRDECLILAKIQCELKTEHPNLVNLRCLSWAGTELFLCVDLANGGSLADAIKGRHSTIEENEMDGGIDRTVSVTILRHIALGVSAALQALHSLGTTHRDLKPSNVLVHWEEEASGEQDCDERSLWSAPVESWRPLVCDFGISKSLIAVENSTLTATGALLGTPLFIAPEVLRGERNTFASDVYSFALTLADVANANDGGILISDSEFKTFFFSVRNGWRPDVGSALRAEDPELTALIKRCWSDDPLDRPSFAEISSQLKSSSNTEFDGLMCQRELACTLETDGEHDETRSKGVTLSHSRIDATMASELLRPLVNITAIAINVSTAKVVGWSQRFAEIIEMEGEGARGRSVYEFTANAVDTTALLQFCASICDNPPQKFVTASPQAISIDFWKQRRSEILNGSTISSVSSTLDRVTVAFEIFVPTPLEYAESRSQSSDGGKTMETSKTQAIVVCYGRDMKDEAEMAQRQHLMMASLSHELRTPLNSIVAYLDLFESGISVTKVQPIDTGGSNDPPSDITLAAQTSSNDPTNRTSDPNKLVARALKSARLLDILINDVLDASRASRGVLAVALTPVSFDFQKEMDSIIDLMSANARKLKSFTLDIGQAVPPSVYFDVVRFKQITINLCSNAIKFTPAGGTVFVRVRVVSAAAAHAAAVQIAHLEGNITTLSGVKGDADLNQGIQKNVPNARMNQLPNRQVSGPNFAAAARDVSLPPFAGFRPSAPPKSTADTTSKIAVTWPQDNMCGRGGGRITRHIRVEVEDSGCGIAEGEMSAIFTRFFSQRSENNLHGLGLGLSISYQLVTAMGGTIGVRSEIGRGSTFHFTLPLRRGYESPAPNSPAKDKIPKRDDLKLDSENCETKLLSRVTSDDSPDSMDANAQHSDGSDEDMGRVRAPPSSDESVLAGTDESDHSVASSTTATNALDEALLAEDDVFSLDVQTMMLERVGFEVKGFETGEALLEYFKHLESMQANERPRLIVLDSHMPGMSGHETASAIREFERAHNFPPVKILGVSAGAVEDESVRSFAAGVDFILSKPINLSKLQKIKEALG